MTLAQFLSGPDADRCTATFDLISRSADSTTGAGPVTFTTSAGDFWSLTAVAEDTLPTAGKPSSLSFRFGFFSWTVDGLALGKSVTMTMTYPSPVESGAAFWKVIGTDWIDASSLRGATASVR